MRVVDQRGIVCMPSEAKRFESPWVTIPAACGVSPGHDQRLRQEARPGLPEAPREPPIGSVLKYPATRGGNPLFTHEALRSGDRRARNLLHDWQGPQWEHILSWFARPSDPVRPTTWRAIWI